MRGAIAAVLIAVLAGCTAHASVGPSPVPSLGALPTATIAAAATSTPSLIPGPTARPATWTSTGDRVKASEPLAATLLLDGRVLVVDGPDDVHSQSASAELYDPASGTWAATGTLITPRYDAYTVTRLADGKVLVAGGSNPSADDLYAAELYDPATGAWARTGRMTQGRYGHTAILLPNGQVLVTGGGALYGPATAELYNPATGSWTATGHLLKARIAYTATLLLDGRVLVAGGLDDSALAAAEVYDPDRGAWTATGRMVNGHADYVSVLLLDGKVLLVASNGNELYDPSSGSWTLSGPMATHNAGARGLTLLSDGRVLVVGCCNDPVTLGEMNRAELFDEATGAWTAVAAAPAGCEGGATALLPNGSVLFVSAGCLTDADGNGIATASAELFDPGGETP